jgi:signal transduction histidine kinase
MNLLMLQQNENIAAGNSIGNLIQLSETAIAGVRSISHQLMPPQLEAFGLAKTLESVITNINNQSGISFNYHLGDNLHLLPWPVSLGCYRIVMELINNTLKHAEAHTINMAITLDANSLSCHYNDDGKGLPQNMKTDCLGLISIEARANALGGIFEYGNNPVGRGFYASIGLPLTT